MNNESVGKKMWFCPVRNGTCAANECRLWTGGAGGSCCIAKAAAVLPEIENRLYEVRQDLRDGLRDIQRELEGR